jgi:tetratricopeptide (TPR) repeat protein
VARVKRPLKKSPNRDPAEARRKDARAAPSAPSPGGRRVWVFRLLALTLVPLLLIGTAELVLRFANYGYSTAFFQRTTVNGVDFLVENPHFGLRFFPAELARSPAPVVMPAKKPPGRYRIFLLGESAALGDPAPAFGFGRYLEVLLRERYPKSDFEVVCAAMTAINSHAILPIAHECACSEGDLWVVYMGNNEMVGPFGAATVFGAKAPALWQVRMTLALKKLRLVQALASLRETWRGDHDGQAWEGMKMFLENRIAPDDPKRDTVCQNFRANLDQILAAGERADVPIVLSTVAVNLREFAPFSAMPSRTAATTSASGLKEQAGTATAAQTAGKWAAAIQAYERALTMVPAHADIEFRLGQCQLALSNQVAARAWFAAARDHDALPFRTDSRLNSIIEELGRAHGNRGVHLLDGSASVSANSPASIPGDEVFYEHVHFNFDGNYRFARALAESIAAQLPAGIREGGAPVWATQEQCDRRLALTAWNRWEVYSEMLQRLSQPPFTGQPDNGMRLAGIRAKLAELRPQLTSTNAAVARQVYSRAIEARPGDFRLEWNYAEFLEATRDLRGATEAWRKVQSLIPHHHVAYYQVGRLLAEQGQREEGRKALNRALELRPDLGAGWYELGILCMAEERFEEALQHLARARRLVPQNPRIPLQSAKALSRLKRSAEAIQQAREAVRLDPASWQARSFLGEELAFVGNHAEARQEFEAVVKLNPRYALGHLNLGVALFKLGQPADAAREFEEALRLEPQLALASQYLERLKSGAPP